MQGKEIQFIGNQLILQQLPQKPIVVVIDKSKAKMYELPEYGETTVVCHQGSVKRVNTNENEIF